MNLLHGGAVRSQWGNRCIEVNQSTCGESLWEFAVAPGNTSQGYTVSASLSSSPTLLSTPAFFHSFVFPLACLIPQNLSLNLAVVCGSMDAGPSSA